jgi:HK97 family phage major capsid protein
MDKRATRLVDMPQQRRLAPVQSIKAESRTVTVMWSAGARVRRYDWWEDESFIEELDMSSGAVDMTRLMSGAPVLNTHDSSRLDSVLGVVERAWLQDGKGYAELRFSEREDVQPFWRDVESGIIRNVSVGYSIIEMREVGRDKESGFRVLRAVKWQPFEISMVAVGADAEAGTRAAQTATTRCAINVEQRDAVSQPAAPAASLKGVTQVTAVVETPAAGPQAATPQATQLDPVQMERDRKVAIENLCRAMNLDVRMASHWIASGKDFKAISDEALKVLEERGKDKPAEVAAIGLTDKEVSNFSLFRMISAVQSGDFSKAGFEKRCHEAVAAQVMNKLGRGAQAENNFFIPAEVLKAQVHRQQRDIVAGTGSAGGFLVETANVSFIDLLRNRSVLFNMGARRLSGLVGNVAVPRQNGAAVANWMSAESGTGAAFSDQTFGQMALTPKTVVAATRISRQLQLQSDPSAESIVMSDLAAQVALAVDQAGLNGSGASGQPTGIITTGGIGAFTGTSITYALLLNSQTDLAVANTLTEGCGYVSHPLATELLMTRQRFTSTDTPLWTGNMLNGQCIGYRAMTSNQMPASRLLFGDFSQVVVGEWGVLELAVNPVENFLAGIIGLRAMYSVDIGVRYSGAFSYAANNLT